MRRQFPRPLGIGALIIAMAGGGILLSRAYIGRSWTMADEIKQKEILPEQAATSVPKPVNRSQDVLKGVDMALLAMSSMRSDEGKTIKPLSTTCIANSAQMDLDNGFAGSSALRSGSLNGENGIGRDIMGGSAEIRPIYEGNPASRGEGISFGR